jgi:hypothetical protein
MLMEDFTKIRPIGAELIHAEGQADRPDETGAFRVLAKKFAMSPYLPY